jgi:hypothetical protein
MMLIFNPKVKFVTLDEELISKLSAQQQLMAKPRSLSNNATKSPLKVSKLIVKNAIFH